MRKLFFAAFSLILFGVVVWFFTVGRITISPDSFYSFPPSKQNTYKEKTLAIDLAGLREKQSSEGRKMVVDELGSATYSFDGKVMTLREGTYEEQMNENMKLGMLDVFFSPTDNSGKEPAVAILGSQKNVTDSTSVYLVVRLPDGVLTPGVLLGQNQQVHTVDLKNGIVTVTHSSSQEDPNVEESRFALTVHEHSGTPILEAVPDTIVLK